VFVDNEVASHLIELKGLATQTLSKQEDQDKRLEKIEDAISGNGKPGLEKRVSDLEDTKKNILWVGGSIFTLLTTSWEYILHRVLHLK
jgi:hypothetical protein